VAHGGVAGNRLREGRAKGAVTTSTGIWQVPPHPHPVLAETFVHVWRARTPGQPADLASLEQVLTADERARAAAFRREEDRARFVLGRGLLRVLLGRYTHQPAAGIGFTSNSHGKPMLVSGPGDDRLEFSVSHSGEWVLVALARGRAVGVDVERVRPQYDWQRVAESFFAPGESAALAALPPAERLDSFFRCWVRKEAYVKALGKGLSASLRDFEVSLAPGEPARLLRRGGEDPEARSWSLEELSLGPGYAAGLAVEGQASLSCWDWHPGR
jgi:4'-phosphopantetheinyl transferase